MIVSGHNNKSKTVIWHDDLTSLANSQVSDVNTSSWKKYIDRFNNDYSEREHIRWFGLPSINKLREAVELYGWPEGVKKANDVIKKFDAPKLPNFKRKRIRSDQGHALDIHRVYSGDLAHAWEATKKEHQNRLALKGHINIIIDIGANCGTGDHAFFWRGAVGCILAQSLIKSGRNVRIIAVDCTTNSCDDDSPNMEKLIIAVVLKRFQQHIDMNRLFSGTALSGFYRYYFWKTQFSVRQKMRDSFGSATDFEVDDIDYFLDDTPCLLISNIWNEHQANDRLQQLKVQIEGGNYDG